jgi:hypothetical protein
VTIPQRLFRGLFEAKYDVVFFAMKWKICYDICWQKMPTFFWKIMVWYFFQLKNFLWRYMQTKTPNKKNNCFSLTQKKASKSPLNRRCGIVTFFVIRRQFCWP